jgi:hypothetical protein
MAISSLVVVYGSFSRMIQRVEKGACRLMTA